MLQWVSKEYERGFNRLPNRIPDKRGSERPSLGTRGP